MNLRSLLTGFNYTLVNGTEQIDIENIAYDSRKVNGESVFVCISGAVVDGHSFAADVTSKGARAIVIEKDIDIDELLAINDELVVIRVESTRTALAYMSASFFGNPASKIKTIGVTGTKGKTTTTYMVKSMLEKAGFKVGLIGTIETIIGDEKIKSVNTTPESYVLQEYLDRMVKAGLDMVVMEVSSQGLMLDRVAGFEFDLGIFSNLSSDHIGPNEHKDFNDYLTCKSLLFKQCKTGIINIDDKYANDVIKGHTCNIETYGMKEDAQLRASNISLVSRPGYMGVAYDVSGLMNMNVEVNIPGKFSVYNSLMAIAICRHFGVSEEVIKEALKDVKVKGRVEIVDTPGQDYLVVIDYAHNHMSIESLLSTIKEYEPTRLITVFGAGGNRDKQRRYDMGEVSGRLADLSIITSDNPRTEKPEDIIDDILIGLHKTDGKYITIIDRAEAIEYAMTNAKSGDVIMLIGKGHESYQEINGVKHDFDERKVVADVLAKISK
ncbi:MAG: UDP-N-acetylmuramoyl-L-alanyl-D-glutamate--2,6-diaminopimelate ligase [Lachnospiraceae bacterium]|nr:UDP-N-acetylmuramoyl-L-alanyl-D-glutamate--2,6-diaminopimelate ligase [Lachnospiraceae bacterium]